MSVYVATIFRCDFARCTAVHEYRGRGSIAAAREDAIREHGWQRRGVWDLCPDHRHEATVRVLADA